MQINKFTNRLYGRTRGRSNNKHNYEQYFKNIKKYKFSKLEKTKSYILDIGTGYGETSIYLSTKSKNQTIISCEKYIDGNINLIKNIQMKNIKNIKIYPGNVIDIFEKNPCFEYLNLVWIFFPDPWPKKRHFKRRLINDSFLKKIYSFMQKNSTLFIATDSTSYSRYIMKNLYENKHLFEWVNQHNLYLNLKHYYEVETKYYKKAIFNGRKPSLFILKKI